MHLSSQNRALFAWQELAVLRGLSFEEFDIRIIAGGRRNRHRAGRARVCWSQVSKVVEVTRGARWLEAS